MLLATDPAQEAARRWTAFAYRRWVGEASAPPGVPLPVALVRRLGLGPLLYRVLDELDDDRAREFVAEYRHATTANLVRLSHARRVRDALERAGVRAVVLKGSAFLVRFAGDDLGLRPMGDVDVLVDPASFEQAAQVLRRHGLADDPARYPLATRSRWARAVNFVDARSPVALDVDLHRWLAPWPLASGLSRAILDRHEVVDGWRVPHPAHAVCVTAVHRMLHGFAGNCLELVDLRRHADALDDAEWAELVTTSVGAGVAPAVYAGFRHAVWWLGPASSRDRRRLAELRQRTGPVRRRLLERMAPLASPLSPSPCWRWPLLRNGLVVPGGTASVWRSLAAATVALSLTAADEWRWERRTSAGFRRAARRFLARAAFGLYGRSPLARAGDSAGTPRP